MAFMDSSKANYALENFDKKLELRKIPCPGRYKIPTSNNPKWPACANKRQMIDLEFKKKRGNWDVSVAVSRRSSSGKNCRL